jgi:hypothetical protein
MCVPICIRIYLVYTLYILSTNHFKFYKCTVEHTILVHTWYVLADLRYPRSDLRYPYITISKVQPSILKVGKWPSISGTIWQLDTEGLDLRYRLPQFWEPSIWNQYNIEKCLLRYQRSTISKKHRYRSSELRYRYIPISKIYRYRQMILRYLYTISKLCASMSNFVFSDIGFLFGSSLGCCNSYSVLDTDCGLHIALRINHHPWLMRRQGRPPPPQQGLHSAARPHRSHRAQHRLQLRLQPPERRSDQQSTSSWTCFQSRRDRLSYTIHHPFIIYIDIRVPSSGWDASENSSDNRFSYTSKIRKQIVQGIRNLYGIFIYYTGCIPISYTISCSILMNSYTISYTIVYQMFDVWNWAGQTVTSLDVCLWFHVTWTATQSIDSAQLQG